MILYRSWLAPSYKNKVKLRLEKCREAEVATRVWGRSYLLSRKAEKYCFHLERSCTGISWPGLPEGGWWWWVFLLPEHQAVAAYVAVHLSLFHLVVNMIDIYFKEKNLLDLVFSHFLPIVLADYLSRETCTLICRFNYPIAEKRCGSIHGIQARLLT